MGQKLEILDELKYQLADYLNWFNNDRIHPSRGYLSQGEYKQNVFCSSHQQILDKLYLFK